MISRRLLNNTRTLLLAVVALAVAGVAASMATTPTAAQHGRAGDARHRDEPPAEGDGQHDGGYSPDSMLVVSGFTVNIEGAGSGTDVDSAWETVSGGSLNIEVADSSIGSGQVQTTTPGQKYVDTLTLRGPLTAGRRSDAPRSARRQDALLENGAGKFRVEIGGAPTASANVESVTIEDLTIDEREPTSGADWDYRVFAPGDAHFGQVTIRAAVAGDESELAAWIAAASEGKDAGRDVSVAALAHDGSEARKYVFVDCWPVRYTPLATAKYPGIAMEEIAVRCASVRFETDGQRKDLLDWITDTVQGKDWKRDVVVKEITRDGSEGRTVSYFDAFPTRYVFPAFSASGTGNLYEEVAIKPIRLELP